MGNPPLSAIFQKACSPLGYYSFFLVWSYLYLQIKRGQDFVLNILPSSYWSFHLKQREAVTKIQGVSTPFAFVNSSLRVQYTHKKSSKWYVNSPFLHESFLSLNYIQAWRLKQNPFQIIANAAPDSAAAVAFEQYDASPPPREAENASSPALSTFVDSGSIKTDGEMHLGYLLGNSVHNLKTWV